MSEPRRNFRVALDVEVSMMSENNFYACVADNISEGGVFVATHLPPKVGAEVEMQLTLPESQQSFCLHGVVRWIRPLEAACEGAPPGCGIQWRGLPEEALEAIAAFVHRRETILFEDAA